MMLMLNSFASKFIHIKIPLQNIDKKIKLINKKAKNIDKMISNKKCVHNIHNHSYYVPPAEGGRNVIELYGISAKQLNRLT